MRLGFRVYLKLPNPTFLWVLIINPSMEFIGTLQKSRFWEVRFRKDSQLSPLLGFRV